MEAKIESKQEEIENLLKVISDIKAENKEILIKYTESQKVIQLLEFEKQELLSNAPGELTNRTSKVINNQITTLELKFDQYEENIEILKDEQIYQKFIIDQMEENRLALIKENCKLKSMIKSMIMYQRALLDSRKAREIDELINSESKEKVIEDQYNILSALIKIKTTLSDNYTKKSNIGDQNNKRKSQKENYHVSRLPMLNIMNC